MLATKNTYPVITPQNTVLRVSTKNIPVEDLTVGGEFFVRVNRVGTPHDTYAFPAYSKQNDILLFSLEGSVFARGEGRYEYGLFYETLELDRRQFVYALDETGPRTEASAPKAAPAVTATKAVGVHNVDPQAHAALFIAVRAYIDGLISGVYSSAYTDADADARIAVHVSQPDPHSQYAKNTALNAIAFSGSYGDLSGVPFIPPAYTTEEAQDAAAGLFLLGGHSGIGFAYDDASNRVTATNLAPFTVEAAQDAAAALFLNGTHAGITFTYNDTQDKIIANVASNATIEAHEAAPNPHPQYLLEVDADERYLTQAIADGLYLTEATADGLYLTEGVADTLYAPIGSGAATKTRQFVTTTATLIPAATDEEAGTNAQAGPLTIASPAGAAWVDGDTLVFRFKDDGTARAMTWDAAYVYFGAATFPATTTAGKWMYFTAIRNAIAGKWHVMAAQVQL